MCTAELHLEHQEKQKQKKNIFFYSNVLHLISAHGGDGDRRSSRPPEQPWSCCSSNFGLPADGSGLAATPPTNTQAIGDALKVYRSTTAGTVLSVSLPRHFRRSVSERGNLEMTFDCLKSRLWILIRTSALKRFYLFMRNQKVEIPQLFGGKKQ